MHASRSDERGPQTKGRTIHWASLYDLVARLLFVGKERNVREMTIDLAEIKPGDTVLDVGCGTGSLTLAAKARVGPEGVVHGIDAAREMVEVARRKAGRRSVDADYHVGLIEDIPFPEKHFDVVSSSLMLHHLPDDLKQTGFEEIYRVLKLGGRFLAVDFELPSLPWQRHLASAFLGHDMMRSNVAQLASMLEGAGFIEVEAGRTRHAVIAFLRGRAAPGM